MFSYQIMRKKCLLWATLALTSLVCHPFYAQVKEKLPLDNPKAVIRDVISAVKTLELQSPVTGRGTAILTSENYPPDTGSKTQTVNFAFKEQKSRTDIFESIDGKKGSKLETRIVTDKYYLNYIRNGSPAVIINRPQSSYRSVGKDFHPMAFLSFKNRPLTYLLEKLLDLPKEAELQVELDKEGMINLIAYGHVVTPTGDEYDHEYQFSFDTQKDLLPVSYSSEMRYPEPNNWGRTQVVLEWAKSNSVYYISRAEYSTQPGNVDRKVVQIKNFSHDVKVDDQEFTLDGMDIPDGVLVGDKIAGVTYRYEAHKAQQQKETSVEEVKATIRKVIPALKALEAKLPTSGRGTAIMETENYLPWFDSKELTMDFVFKGQNSRWDAIEWVDGNKSSRLWARVIADKYMITFASDDTVTINQTKVHDFIRNDFHPVSFVSFKDYLLRSQLQDILDYDLAADPEKYASADLDDNGILHIVNGGPVTRPKGLYFEHQMSFDTKRELVPFPLNKFQFC